jgi:hypothetical protein
MVLAVIGASAAQQAQAVDWCKVLLCMSHPENYENVAECSAEVPQAYAYAKTTQSWGKCETSADDTQVKVNEWRISRNKKGQIQSVNGTANVYNNGELKKQYPF